MNLSKVNCKVGSLINLCAGRDLKQNKKSDVFLWGRIGSQEVVNSHLTTRETCWKYLRLSLPYVLVFIAML